MRKSSQPTVFSIFYRFLILGLTSFGGPVAHIGFFRTTFVTNLRWMSEKHFSDLLSLCQFIPGPASSQLGMAIAYHQRGYIGAFAGWLGFTLPSALLLYGFATLLFSNSDWLESGLIQGLKLVAVAVVLQAFLAMRISIAPDALRITIMGLSAGVFLLWPSAYAPIVVLTLVGIGASVLSVDSKVTSIEAEVAKDDSHDSNQYRHPHRIAWFFLLLFSVLLALSFADGVDGQSLLAQQFASYYQSGALVFGGGHVVLPMLDASVVESGWVDESVFLAGYGAAQAVPGPLFTFASFLGAAHEIGATGAVGAVLAIFAIFLPSFLLLFGVLPYWETLRNHPRMRSALWGINAAVLGLLLATLYDPVITLSIGDARDAVFAGIAYLALTVWRAPVPLVVASGALLGFILY